MGCHYSAPIQYDHKPPASIGVIAVRYTDYASRIYIGVLYTLLVYMIIMMTQYSGELLCYTNRG